MLTKKYRLKSSRDFKIVYKHGYKIRGRFGMLISLPPRDKMIDPPKFGFVVSKKIGNAVARHKMTRQLRSLIHENIKQFENSFNGYRFTYIAFEKPEIFAELKSELVGQIKKAASHTHS